MSGNLEIREGDSNETVRAGQDLETIWSNPEMLSDLPALHSKLWGLTQLFPPSRFFGVFCFLCFFWFWGLEFCKMEVQIGQALWADGAKEAT